MLWDGPEASRHNLKRPHSNSKRAGIHETLKKPRFREEKNADRFWNAWRGPFKKKLKNGTGTQHNSVCTYIYIYTHISLHVQWHADPARSPFRPVGPVPQLGIRKPNFTLQVLPWSCRPREGSVWFTSSKQGWASINWLPTRRIVELRFSNTPPFWWFSGDSLLFWKRLWGECDMLRGIVKPQDPFKHSETADFTTTPCNSLLLQCP